MEEQLISFDTAKLAKEKGFNWKCFGNYHIGRIKGREYIVSDALYCKDWNSWLEPIGYDRSYLRQLTTSAPTQSLLQKWLRDIHKIHITPHYHKSGKYNVNICDDCENSIALDVFGELYNTYEDALEAGLLETLKLI